MKTLFNGFFTTILYKNHRIVTGSFNTYNILW